MWMHSNQHYAATGAMLKKSCLHLPVCVATILFPRLVRHITKLLAGNVCHPSQMVSGFISHDGWQTYQ